ncbi:hypothetical protein [Paraburkholderia kururiensis]|uniref:Uncharacterized protein n=1 Tax=Paraburkholderia kururiensis TaxID=984307 RepID=A0ABZ0WLC7_9BURK|nr:hypothetical protein [Paraburkholderia kururiensis]WQD78163.1 hypothetical protein U0042_00110 [Paraburkholderia kururiensis]
MEKAAYLVAQYWDNGGSVRCYRAAERSGTGYCDKRQRCTKVLRFDFQTRIASSPLGSIHFQTVTRHPVLRSFDANDAAFSSASELRPAADFAFNAGCRRDDFPTQLLLPLDSHDDVSAAGVT